jgi:pSer/pThr/pTyr-binding forkhead associated (FHA) protein
MDPLDIAILALRLALVLVLYLFLLAVVRAATRTLRAESRPAPRAPSARPLTPTAAAKPTPLRLQVLEPGSSGLPPGELIEVADGATLGRAGQASVVVADPTVSGQHARVERLDGNAWMVVDLGSTNGTLVNQALVQGDAALAPGDVLGLGNVRLKVVGS